MTSTALDPLMMKRLAFIQMLFHQGIEQSRLPEPLNVTSVLSLHDASELFLVLAVEKLGAPLRHGQLPFMEYWALLDPSKLPGGVTLSGAKGMRRLNDLRNALKHSGTMPSATAVSQACEDVRRFLEDNTLSVFSLAFTDIDMAEVIPQAHIRDKVRAASAAEISGDRMEAIALLAEAYAERYTASPRSDSSFGPSIRTQLPQGAIAAILWQPAHPQRPRPPGDHHQLAEQISQVTKAVQEMQSALEIMSLGIDYRQFQRFLLITPGIAHFVDGHSERRFMDDDHVPTVEEFEYCRQFIITLALRMAEREPHTIEPSWWSS
jgi:hypothetical protein